MSYLVSFLFFCFGLLLGSFFNVVALRVPKGESVLHPPSHCPSCHRQLGVRDLVPLLSYLISRGRCRFCGAKISPLYPVGELSTGIFFLLAYLEMGFRPELWVALLLISLSVIISISDLAYMLIPNKVLLFFFPLLLLLRLFIREQEIWSYLIGMLAAGGLLLLIALRSSGGMGMGDVKLFAVYGLVLGPVYAFLALFLASFAGALVGGALILSGRKTRKSPIPFGPFLALGAIIAELYGGWLLDTYLSLF